MGFGPKLTGATKLRGKAISVRIALAGNSRVLKTELRFSAELAAEIKATRCDAQEGDDGDYGKVLLTFDEKGEFSICRSKSKTKTWLVLPLLKCVPEGYTFTAKECRFIWKDRYSSMYVTMPFHEWKKDIQETAKS